LGGLKMKNKQKLIGSILILALFIIFLITGYIMTMPKKVNANDVFVQSTPIENKDSSSIVVCINGEVKAPGVYELKSGSRLRDLIKSAGGLNADAEISKLNMAKKLKDEDLIFIDKVNIVNGVKIGTTSSLGKISSTSKININIATKEELDTLPGIGAITAQSIIDYREKNGDFSTIEDIKKVGRIGDKTLEKFKDRIDVH
jgi:competence protein ComEA